MTDHDPGSDPNRAPPRGPDRHGTSFFAAHAVASPPRPRLTVETDVDVCVIGGGLAGLTAAREVARRGWSVMLLEAQQVAWNASGRNLGFVLPGFAASAEALVARVGIEHARKLWALSEAGAEYVRNAISETAMPGAELNEAGWLQVSKTDRTGAMVARFDVLNELGAQVEAWPVERVRSELRSQLYFDAIHYSRGFSINPLNYALGLAAAAEAAGARICENTAALQIDPVGVRKRIIVQGSRVRAAHVVLAGNVQIAGLMPQFAATLLRSHRYVIATESLGRALRELVRYGGAVSDGEFADNHYRVVDGDRLLWSGRSTVWRGKPQRYVGTLSRDIARAYPALRGVKVEYAWSGTLGQTVHRMPQIGEIAPGLWLLSGFGDHGLNTTAMGGELLARAIVEGDRTWQLFNPFGMVWAGGGIGRAMQQAMTWALRGRDRLQSRLARQREKLRGPIEPLSVAAEIMEAAPIVEPTPEPAMAPVIEPPAPEQPQGPDAAPVPPDAAPPQRRKRGKRRRSKPVAAETAAPGDDGSTNT